VKNDCEARGLMVVEAERAAQDKTSMENHAEDVRAYFCIAKAPKKYL